MQILRQDTAKFYLKALQMYHLEHGLDINVFRDPHIASVLGEDNVLRQNPQTKASPNHSRSIEKNAHAFRLGFDGIKTSKQPSV
jgi:hypothetical protein